MSNVKLILHLIRIVVIWFTGGSAELLVASMFFLMPYLREELDLAKVDWESLNFNFSYITQWGPSYPHHLKSNSEAEFYSDAYKFVLKHMDLNSLADACGDPKRAHLAADVYDYITTAGGL